MVRRGPRGDGDLLPWRWHHMGWLASGPPPPPPHREPAAGQAGGGDRAGARFGHDCHDEMARLLPARAVTPRARRMGRSRQRWSWSASLPD